MSEKTEIKLMGGKPQKNSGRGKISKGDAIWFDFVVDTKEYPNGFRVTKDNWAKICTDTFTVDRAKSPAFQLVLGEGNKKTRLGVVEWGKLETLVRFYNENS